MADSAQHYFQAADYAVFVVLLLSSAILGVILGIVNYFKNKKDEMKAEGETGEAEKQTGVKVEERNLSRNYNSL